MTENNLLAMERLKWFISEVKGVVSHQRFNSSPSKSFSNSIEQ